MSKVPRSYDELKAAVEHQLIFLKDYCQKYDDGNIQYASQIASRIRVLLSDSKNSKSAITLLQDATGVKISLYRDHRNYPKPHFDNEGRAQFFQV